MKRQTLLTALLILLISGTTPAYSQLTKENIDNAVKTTEATVEAGIRVIATKQNMLVQMKIIGRMIKETYPNDEVVHTFVNGTLKNYQDDIDAYISIIEYTKESNKIIKSLSYRLLEAQKTLEEK